LQQFDTEFNNTKLYTVNVKTQLLLEAIFNVILFHYAGGTDIQHIVNWCVGGVSFWGKKYESFCPLVQSTKSDKLLRMSTTFMLDFNYPLLNSQMFLFMF
jgi:hypothetical protein